MEDVDRNKFKSDDCVQMNTEFVHQISEMAISRCSKSNNPPFLCIVLWRILLRSVQMAAKKHQIWLKILLYYVCHDEILRFSFIPKKSYLDRAQ